MTPDDGDGATIMVGHLAPGGAGVSTDPLAVPMARLICLDDSQLDPKQKGLVIALTGGIHTLGRNPNNTDPILYKGVSGQHARISPLQGKWAIEDLGSTNGVWIKGIREKHAFLVPGDFIKIGAVPFQFVVDDPVAVAPSPRHGQSVDNETMFLGGNHEDNADKIVKLLDLAQEEEVEEKPSKEAGRAASVPSMFVKSEEPSPKVSIKMIVLFILLLALVGGGYGIYTLQKGPGGGDEVQRYQKEIKKFLDAYEMVKGTLSNNDLNTQIATIEGLLKPLSADAERYPGNMELKELQVRLRFLRLERQVILFAQEEHPQQTESMVDELVAFVSADWTRSLEKQAWLKDMRGLLDLVKNVVTVQQFRQRYPRPSKKSTDRPTQEWMTSMGKVSGNIVKLKKDTSINILLSVQFPLFGRIVTQVDEEDLPAISRWKEVLQ